MISLFPSAVLDSSILTSVLVGLLVTWILQETLGWNFTGIVVPGYLASILVIQPLTGLVVATEAVVTCLVVRAISDGVPRGWLWTPLFGRDRFFLIMAVSVGIRLLFEGGGFGVLMPWLGQEGLELHSIGLVLVPLAANALWRTGLARGAVQVGLPVAITWAVLQLVLLPLTNLNLAGFELTYEDVARDFLASPKAYMILLSGAWLGSMVNMRVGWDFGGIIVPGLLALCWLSPATVAATMGEALAIAAMTVAALRLPVLRNANVTGGRPLVLAFLLGFALKFTLAWTLDGAWPGLEVRSLFGFGYLLPSLLALRVVKTRDPLRVVISVTTVSATAFAGASGLGLLMQLYLGPPGPPPAHVPEGIDATTPGAALVAAFGRPDATRTLDDLLAPTAGWATRAPGAVRTLDDGAGLAVVIDGTDAASLEAGLVVADSVHPAVTVLCTATGDGCARATQAAAASYPTLRVRAGDTTALTVRRSPPDALDLAALSAALPAMRLEQGDVPYATLTVGEADRWRLAASGLGGHPQATLRLDELGARPDGPRFPSDRDRALARMIGAHVVPALRRWLARDEHGDEALAVVAGLGATLGVAVGRSGDEIALVGAGWYARLDRDGSPVLVHVPYSGNEPGTMDLGASVWRARRGLALVVDDPPTLDALYDVARAPMAVAVALVGAVGEAGEVVTVRGTRDVYDPGGDVVASRGRPEPAPDRPPLPEVAEDVAWYDGTAIRLSFQDPSNPVRLAADWIGRTHRTAFVSNAIRADLEAIDPAVGVAELPMPVRYVAWADLVAAVDPEPPPASLGGSLDAVATALDGGRSDRRGADLTLVCEAALGCRWIAVRRCVRGACVEALRPTRRRGDDHDPDPAARLALGSLPIALRPEKLP